MFRNDVGYPAVTPRKRSSGAPSANNDALAASSTTLPRSSTSARSVIAGQWAYEQRATAGPPAEKVAQDDALAQALAVADNSRLMSGEYLNRIAAAGPSGFGLRLVDGPWLAGTATWSQDATRFTFQPAGTLSVGAKYEVHVNQSASDHSDPGNPFATGPSVWTFTAGSSLGNPAPPMPRKLLLFSAAITSCQLCVSAKRRTTAYCPDPP